MFFSTISTYMASMTEKTDLIPPSPDYQDAETPSDADEAALFSSQDPIALFRDWLALAGREEINDPNAMSLATVDDTGLPDVRMVLLKDVDQDGFVFYTNTTSAKGQELATNPKAALCFHWKSLRRQVRVRGDVSRVSDEEADAYFQSRARDSRIGAWASDQSAPMEGRFALEQKIAQYGLKYAVGHIPRPPHWTGFRVSPVEIEFWRDRPFRLHDRRKFTRTGTGDGWQTSRLFP